MEIYPDASFLVSWLYKPDPLNPQARVWFARHQTDDFLILEQLNPDLFVSGDKDQLSLATARGFRSARFY
jgi:hypothetical protein